MSSCNVELELAIYHGEIPKEGKLVACLKPRPRFPTTIGGDVAGWDTNSKARLVFTCPAAIGAQFHNSWPLLLRPTENNASICGSAYLKSLVEKHLLSRLKDGVSEHCPSFWDVKNCQTLCGEKTSKLSLNNVPLILIRRHSLLALLWETVETQDARMALPSEYHRAGTADSRQWRLRHYRTRLKRFPGSSERDRRFGSHNRWGILFGWSGQHLADGDRICSLSCFLRDLFPKRLRES